MNYYFLAASMPELSLDRVPQITLEQLRESCSRHMTPPDYKALCDLLDSDSEASSCPAVMEWRNAETQLRNELAKARGSNIKRDPSPYLRQHDGFDAGIHRVVGDAFSRQNPLETEIEIERFRWKRASELAGLNPFSLRAILAYALKLEMAERWAAFDADAGRKVLEEVVSREPAETGSAGEES